MTLPVWSVREASAPFVLRFGGVLWLVAAIGVGAAGAEEKVALGELDCTISGVTPSPGFPEATVACSFAPAAGEAVTLSGTLSGIGSGVEIAPGASLVWAVFAPAGGDGVLRGSFAYGPDHVELEGGVRAAVLISTDARLMELRPVRISGIEAEAGTVRVQRLRLE